MEVAPGVHRIDTPLGDRRCSVYLLVGAENAVLVDTGLAGAVASSILPYLDGIGLPPERVRLVLISHADIDHCGDAAAAKATFPDALLACHLDDAAEIASLDVMVSQRYGQFAANHGIDDGAETKAWFAANGRFAPPDLLLSGGESVRLGADWLVDILHVPGHSRGHLAVWDPRSRSAITIDAALGRTVPLADGTPAFPPTYRYVDAYLGTLERLAALEPALLLTAHEPTMDAAAGRAFLADSRAFAEDAERAVLATLRADGPLPTADVLRRVGPTLGPWPVEAVLSALAFPLVGHLERLEQVGAVRREQGADGYVVWEAAAA